jgi:TonB family protein
LAVGCCWATCVIARERSVATVPATNSSIAHADFPGYTQDDTSIFSRRTATFVFVASLHAAVLAGLVIGLSAHFTQVTPTQFVALPKAPPSIDRPSPPEPEMSKATIELPPIKEPLIAPDPAVTDTARETLGEPQRGLPRTEPAAPTVVVNRVQGAPGIGFPSADDFYPSHSIRLGEQGAATVRACVDGKGRLISDPTVAQSSGSSRLDEAALKLAKAGSGHYQATTEDGRPVNSCYPFRIRFQLRN